MANYTQLIKTINDNIKANGNQEITGPVLNAVLQAIVRGMSEGALFAGIADTTTNPPAYDGNVFYIALEPGTYSNFGGIEIESYGVHILENTDGAWSLKEVMPVDSELSAKSRNPVENRVVTMALKDKGFFNISTMFPTGGENGGNTYTLQTAANKFLNEPIEIKKAGGVMCFLNANGIMEFYRAEGINYSSAINWQRILVDVYNLTNEKPLPDGQYYQCSDAEADNFAPNSVSSHLRRLGFLLLIRTAEYKWDLFKFVSSSLRGWAAANRWIRLADSEDLAALKSQFAQIGIGKVTVIDSATYNLSCNIPKFYLEENVFFGLSFSKAIYCNIPQLDVSSTGLKDIIKCDDSDLSLTDIRKTDKVYLFQYNGQKYVLLNPDDTLDIEVSNQFSRSIKEDLEIGYISTICFDAVLNTRLRTKAGILYKSPITLNIKDGYVLHTIITVDLGTNTSQYSSVNEEGVYVIPADNLYRRFVFRKKDSTAFEEVEDVASIIGLSDSADEETGVETERLDLTKVDTLLLIGTSHTEGNGSLKDKSMPSYLSALNDWNVINLGISGCDYVECYYYLLNNMTLTGSKWEDVLTGGVCLDFLGGNAENTYFYNPMDAKYSVYNMKRLYSLIKSKGFKIIPGSYWGDQANSFAAVQLKVAKELGLDVININNECYRINAQKFLPYWFNAHFATRTVANQFYTLNKNYRIEKARTAIKIFRNRVDVDDNSKLLYGSLFERLRYWRELSIGHRAIKNGLENYVDRQDLYRQDYSLVVPPIEYTSLRNKESIQFSDKALIEFILPSTAHEIHNFRFGLGVSSTPQVYVRKYSGTSLAIPITPASAVFVIQSEIDEIFEGDVFTDTLNEGVQFTVVSVYSDTNQIICSANGTFVNPGATTDTLTRVSDSKTFTATNLTSGVPQSYLDRAEEPFGSWELLSLSEDGLYHIDDMRGYMDYDKVSILVDNNKSAFTMNDVYALYDKPKFEKDRKQALFPIAHGDLSSTLLEDTFESSEGVLSDDNGSYLWDGNETYKDKENSDVTNNHIPNYYLNKGAAKILHLKKGDKITYTIPEFNHSGSNEPVLFRLKVVCRYFPASNLDINAGSFTITPETFDFARLGIKFSIGSANSVFTDEEYVPASFVELEKDIYLDMSSVGNKLELIAIDDDIEIIYVKLTK